MTDGADVAKDLVRQLEANAELVDAGQFTLDYSAARTKLGRYRQADPQAFLFDAVFIDLAKLDSTAARQALGRQRLALAIDAVLAQPDTAIELRATSTDLREFVVNFTATGQTVEEVDGEADASCSLSLTFEWPLRFEWPKDLDEVANQQRAVLEDRARHAELPVLVEGSPIVLSTVVRDADPSIAIMSATGTPLGRAGWSSARTQVILLAHGVIVEELGRPAWPPGFVALVDVADLRRDLSLTKLVRDEAFEARMAAVRAARDALPRLRSGAIRYALPRPQKDAAPIGWSIVFALLVGGGGLGMVAPDLLWISMLVVATGVSLAVVIGVDQEGAARRAQAPRGVGEVQSVEQFEQYGLPSKVRLTLRVSMAQGDPFKALVSPPVPLIGDPLRPGDRVHVRVDPDNHERVWLDVPATRPPRRVIRDRR